MITVTKKFLGRRKVISRSRHLPGVIEVHPAMQNRINAYQSKLPILRNL